MSQRKITMIGGGNMGCAIAAGLLKRGFSAEQINIVEPSAERRLSLQQEYGFNCYECADKNCVESNVIVLAVKPQIMRDVLTTLRPLLQPIKQSALIVSIAAGITTKQIDDWLKGAFKIVRVMPNTPAMIGVGASALFANEASSATDKALADDILSAVGISVWVDKECDIDAVTALSGSGPAYFFLVLEALEKAAVELGLTAQTARQLAIQTALGAASLAQQSGTDPAVLRQQVTSPGGTTERALEVLVANDLEHTFSAALKAAHQRAQDLAKESG